jgi:hypothetical protein
MTRYSQSRTLSSSNSSLYKAMGRLVCSWSTTSCWGLRSEDWNINDNSCLRVKSPPLYSKVMIQHKFVLENPDVDGWKQDLYAMVNDEQNIKHFHDDLQILFSSYSLKAYDPIIATKRHNTFHIRGVSKESPKCIASQWKLSQLRKPSCILMMRILLHDMIERWKPDESAQNAGVRLQKRRGRACISEIHLRLESRRMDLWFNLLIVPSPEVSLRRSSHRSTRIPSVLHPFRPVSSPSVGVLRTRWEGFYQEGYRTRHCDAHVSLSACRLCIGMQNLHEYKPISCSCQWLGQYTAPSYVA